MSRHRTIIRLSAVLAVVALATGCGDGDSATAPPTPEPARPTTVTVSPATHELTALGITVQLSAEVRDQNARVMAGATVTWTSSASSMATVDASGLVTAAGNGTATITASAGSASGSAVVTVMQSVASVEVSPSVYELTALGQTVQLTAEAFDENGHAVAGAEFSWESSDAAVATVGAGGLVTAVAEGVATITASAGEASGSVVVPVMQPVASVEVSPSAETIELGSTLQLTAEAFDENGEAVAEVEFAWETSDAAVAAVDAGGLVTGVAVGTATITASAGSGQGTAEVTVADLDRAALVALYEATDGPNWVNSENWLTDAPLREWYGVDTDGSGRVVRLDLSGTWEGRIPHGLTGPIPPELGKLSNLTTLDLGINDLTGPIPPELGNLSELTWLSLYSTSLSGPIPPELGSLANLTGLSLGSTSLSGPIPPELGNLSGLTDLFLDHNNLWGPIPRSLLNLTKLNSFPFNDNAGLCAPGTTDFADWLEGMEEREGPFCNASDRAVLAALFEAAGGSGWTNARGWLGGPALAGWHGVRADLLGRVTALDLSRNGLAGHLPGSLGELAHMTELRIADNADLSLRLPLSLSGLSLRVLHYAGTELCVPAELSFRDWLSTIPSHEGTGAECPPATLSGTVNHGWGGWTDSQTNGFGDGASYRPGSSSAGESGVGTAAPAVTTPDGYVIGAVVEVVDGPDAGRQTTTDDRGRYVLEALQQGEFTIRATAEGFASVSGVVDLTADRVLDLAISHEPPTPQPRSPFPDTDPAWLRTLSSDYPYAHQVANVRVFSDISPTFSREHAEHLKRVWEFFHALYGTKNGDWMDVYYTSDPTVYMKAAICATHAATVHTETRNTAWCPLDYVRWFMIPYQIPDFGTQLHEIGHGFLYARWPQAWGDSFPSLWLVEGTAMYWEGGVFTDDGSLRVSTPLNKRYCANGFPDPGPRLIPLADLLRLGEAFYPDPRPTYPQSCMLFAYLEKRAPGVLYALIYRINSGQIVSNDQLITALLDLTGKSISELEEAYQSYAWSMR